MKTDNFYLSKNRMTESLRIRLIDAAASGGQTELRGDLSMSPDLLQSLISSCSPRSSPTDAPTTPIFVTQGSDTTNTEDIPTSDSSPQPIVFGLDRPQLPSASAPRWSKVAYELFFTEYEYPCSYVICARYIYLTHYDIYEI